ncbi:hypothetical protein [Methylobacterium sp.]|uniref:hypothetical protein n=1 Tax=Methylobacterium sp. TaxID=409 RepID=UPI003B01AE8A
MQDPVDMPEHRPVTRSIIYDTKAVQLVRVQQATQSKILVITFTPAVISKADISKLGFAEKFLSSRGFDLLCFISNSSHWWHVQEMEAALVLGEKIASGYEIVSSYGVSMGAYASLYFSERLKISNILAIVPQVTPNVEEPPFDRRWARFSHMVKLKNESLNTVLNKSANITFVYDPLHFDAKHINLIDAPNAEHIPVTFVGHAASRYLGRLDLLKKLAVDVISGQRKSRTYVRSIRRARRKDVEFLLNMSQYCFEHGKNLVACRLANRVVMNAEPEHIRKAIVVLRAARDMFSLGNALRRLAVIDPHDAESRDGSIDAFARFIRRNQGVDGEELVKIIKYAKSDLHSLKLEQLARRHLKILRNKAAGLAAL